jgi:hypothetical protein
MKRFRIASALLASLSVAACGGSSDTSAPAVSRIFDLTLPADFDRSALPTSAQTALEEFERRNAGVIATGGPTGNASGNATFFGNDTVGLVVDNGAGGFALVQGDVQLEMNVNSGLINGRFQDLSITDGSGRTTNLLGQVVRLESGNIVNGRFSNTLSTDGTFNVGGTPASVTGTSQGAFVGDGSEALGVADGSITIGTNPAQGFAGVYTADQL